METLIPAFLRRQRNQRRLTLETATGNEADVALACLIHIDELRDMHGVASGEPRHPDIATGAPWPTLPNKGRLLRPSDMVVTPVPPILE